MLPFVLFIFLFFTSTKTTLSANLCNGTYSDENGTAIEEFVYTSVQKINYTIKINNPVLASIYTIKACNMSTGANLGSPGACDSKDIKVSSGGTLTGLPLDISSLGRLTKGLEITVIDSTISKTICTDYFPWENAPTPTPSKGISCTLDIESKSTIFYDTPISIIGKVEVFGIKNYDLTPNNPTVDCPLPDCGKNAHVHISGPNTGKDFYPKLGVTIDGSKNKSSFVADLKYGYDKGNYTATALIHAKDTDTLFDFVSTTCSIKFNVPSGIILTPTPTLTPTLTPTPTPPDYCNEPWTCKDYPDGRLLCDNKTPDCSKCSYCIPTPKPTSKVKRPTPTPPPLVALCDQLTDKEPSGKVNYRQQCTDCVGTDKPTGKLWTAIGCVPINYSGFISEIVMKTGVGIAGGVAFLYFLYGAFMILTSTGNAEKLEEAKQIITSALAGLILIIFSIFLLKTIGVDILKLPGFG